MDSKEVVAPNATLDKLKWLVVIALIGLIAVGNSMYSGESLLYRVLAGFAIFIVAGFIAFSTTKGARMWGYVLGARIELGRIVWPNKQERNQTTLIVLVIIVIIALILWGMDSLFAYLASLFLK